MDKLFAWDASVIKALSDAYGSAVFLVTQGFEAGALTTLHVTGPGDARRAGQAAKRFGASRTKVARHAPELLATPHSLEGLVSLLTSGQQIIADPTGAVTKAVQLAETGRRARLIMPKRVRGLYFNPSRGLVFAWMREPPAAEDSRGAMEQVLAEAGAEWVCVILSPVVPAQGLVALDEASARAATIHKSSTRVRRWLTTGAAAVGVSGALAAAAHAAPPSSDPLVQAVFKGGGGSIDGKGFGSGGGSVGVFGGGGFGQIDVTGLSAEHLNGGGGALQAGLRDPEHYRAGVFVADGSAVNNFTMAGAFGELFFDKVTLRVVGRDLSVTHGQNKTFFGGEAQGYVDENTKVFASVDSDSKDTLGSAGVEHALQSLSGLALGAAGTFGPHEGGFKVYGKWWFGGPGESLEHHDRYGPAESVMDDLWFAEAQRLGHHATYGGVIETPSDQRLKQDIVFFGRAANGVALYRYRYLGDPRVFVGAMAQELLADPRFAHAVVTRPSGLMTVDYDRLGIDIGDREAMNAAGAAAVAAYEADMMATA